MKDKVRMDVFLANKYGTSRNKVAKMIKDGLVTVDGKKWLAPGELINPSEHIISLDQTIFDNGNQIDTNLEPYPAPLVIVYEDDDILVVNKPSGLLTHPTKYGEKNTLANMIVYHSQCLDNLRSGIVHRLDRDTSGLVLVAKNLITLTKLQRQIQAKAMKRVYLAIVHKPFNEKNGSIDAPIGYCGHNKMKMKINGVHAKQALTKFNVIHQNNLVALIACILVTGRTHQIRVHMDYIRHPVLNDPLYGNNVNNEDGYGQFLHASMLEFIHPTNGKLIHVETAPDEIFLRKISTNGFTLGLDTLYEKI